MAQHNLIKPILLKLNVIRILYESRTNLGIFDSTHPIEYNTALPILSFLLVITTVNMGLNVERFYTNIIVINIV